MLWKSSCRSFPLKGRKGQYLMVIKLSEQTNPPVTEPTSPIEENNLCTATHSRRAPCRLKEEEEQWRTTQLRSKEGKKQKHPPNDSPPPTKNTERHREKIKEAIAERSQLERVLGIGHLTSFASRYQSFGLGSYTKVGDKLTSVGVFGMVFVTD